MRIYLSGKITGREKEDYGKTDGAWTDYFEHTVEEVLKRLLQESKGH